MKYVYVGLILFVLGAVISGMYFDHRMDVVIEREQLKTNNAYHNLNYEITAHEQDVGLLKKENQTLRLQCEAP